MIVALFAGLAVGLIHVLSGPDHLSAITPIACVEQRRVWAIGLRWGLGHSVGVVLVGLVVGLCANLALVDPLSAGSERLVGVMLLLIGGWGFWRLARLGGPAPAAHHPHPHGTRRLAPYAIGILHGCAGGSHLVGILLALAFPTLAGVMTYLAGFVAGSVLAMSGFAAGIGWLATARGVSSGFQRGLVATSSTVTVIIGCWWLLTT
jgi:hypothetical protein